MPNDHSPSVSPGSGKAAERVRCDKCGAESLPPYRMDGQEHSGCGGTWRLSGDAATPNDVLRHLDGVIALIWRGEKEQAVQGIKLAQVAAARILRASTNPLSPPPMSTNDVPGANTANRDNLGVGNWAEHADGSMILVQSTEGDKVVYALFDPGPPMRKFFDAMPKRRFLDFFSVPPVGSSKIHWTWHDKTAFPWDRVMSHTRGATEVPEAGDVLSAAARVAAQLDLDARDIPTESIRHNVDENVRRGYQILDKFAGLLGRAFPTRR